MKIILGSGIVGSTAKLILGDSWELMPMKRSRYFTFETPYADDFIAVHDGVADFVKRFGALSHVEIVKRPFSFGGQLLYDSDDAKRQYLTKVYGEDYPTVYDHALKTTISVYPVSAKVIHDKAQEQIRPVIESGVEKFGRVIKLIDKHRLITENGEFEFDQLLSTIPLNALLRLMRYDLPLQAKDVYFYHIRTNTVDLEGARQSLVADRELDFFKVTRIGQIDYLFMSIGIIENPHFYFGNVIGYDFEIIEVIRIEEALPVGDIPELGFLREYGIKAVGSNAEWNDLVDVSACFRKVMKIKTG